MTQSPTMQTPTTVGKIVGEAEGERVGELVRDDMGELVDDIVGPAVGELVSKLVGMERWLVLQSEPLLVMLTV